MKKIFLITALLSMIFFLTGGIFMVNSAGIMGTRVIDMISVLDCPTIGFVVVNELDNDELLITIEIIAPPEAMADEVFEIRYGQGEEMVSARTRINEFGRGTISLKTARITDQMLEGWIVNAPEWAIEMFTDHPNLLVEEGNMHALATIEAL